MLILAAALAAFAVSPRVRGDPAPKPVQPSIIINNNIQVLPQTSPQVVIPQAPAPQEQRVEAYAFIVGIEAALNNHDWRTLTAFTEDGGVNYFGRRYTSNAYISQYQPGYGQRCPYLLLVPRYVLSRDLYSRSV